MEGEGLAPNWTDWEVMAEDQSPETVWRRLCGKVLEVMAQKQSLWASGERLREDCVEGMWR